MRKINFFLEDPGSSNFILGIRKALDKRNIILKVYAQEFAKKYLKDHKEQVVDFRIENNSIFECDLLVIGTTENKKTKSKLLFEKAKNKKILTGLIIDSPTIVDQEFFIDILMKTKNLIDFIFTSDSRSKKVLIENNIDSKKIIKVTNPKFDFVQNFAKQNYKSEGKKKLTELKQKIPTPEEVIEKLKAEINKETCSPEGKEKFMAIYNKLYDKQGFYEKYGTDSIVAIIIIFIIVPNPSYPASRHKDSPENQELLPPQAEKYVFPSLAASQSNPSQSESTPSP